MRWKLGERFRVVFSFAVIVTATESRAGEVDARVEVLDLRLNSVKGTGGRNAMDDHLVPDFILPKTGCCRYCCSDGFLNGRAMRLEDREGRSIVFGNELDVMVGSEL